MEEKDVVILVTPKVEPGVFPMPEMDVTGMRKKYLDLPYCEGACAHQMLDLYLPSEGEGPFPVIIFIHGGAFWGGDKRDFQAMYVMDGTNRGYAVASINHRLSDECKFPLPVYDVKAAVRYLRANAEKYNLDPNRFAAVGDSAGSYFAAMLATTPGNPAFEDGSMGNPGVDTSIQAAVSLFGVLNLEMQSQFTEDSEPAPGMPKLQNFADLFVGVPCREHPELMKLTWPGTYVTKDCPPMLIQQGTKDEIVPYLNSPELADRVNAVCGDGRAIWEPFEDCTHGHESFGYPENVDRLFRFFDETLK